MAQKVFFDAMVFKRLSCFIDGEAGSGKSYLLRAVAKGL